VTVAPAVKICRWTPDAARKRITELLAIEGLTARERDILTRLATYPTMKTDVWAKLPPDPPDQQGLIIQWSLEAAHYAAMIRPPKPKTKKALAAWHQKYPPIISAEDVQGAAARLRGMIIEYLPYGAAHWVELWPGDQETSIGDAVKFVGCLEEFYRRLEIEHRAAIKAANLPYLRKKGVRNADQVFFSRVMSDRLKGLYNSPLDGVVTALTDVVFDLGGRINEEKTRGRRR
jgi:hypothetical protein